MVSSSIVLSTSTSSSTATATISTSVASSTLSSSSASVLASTTVSSSVASSTISSSPASSSASTTATSTIASTTTYSSASASASSTMGAQSVTSAPTSTSTAIQTSAITNYLSTSATTSSATPTPTSSPAVATVPNWPYLGCYKDSFANRTLPTQRFGLSPITVETCLVSCQKGGFGYGGVEFGSQCFCGNTVPIAAPATVCSTACAGNSTELCGGSGAISIYTYNTTAVPATNPIVPNWPYMGCYSDSPSSRTLTSLQSNKLIATVESCATACAAGKFQYAGLEAGNQCYCGNSLTASVSTACTMVCQNNGAELCGGVNALSVFQFSSGR
ncbi:hypothetical protein HDU98_003548 [Podochytrium sp. JEL0797]|nr:hypothetical protein HDU98_003548 [Podochytrium sp. JEL0797]